jgi:hypothetical protein
MGQRLCPDCEAKEKPARDIWNRIVNGTPRGHAYLQTHRDKKKNRVASEDFIQDKLYEDPEYYLEQIEVYSRLFNSSKVVIWDTETDAVGGGHGFDLTREIYCHEIITNRILHIRKFLDDNPVWDDRVLNAAFSLESTARKFMEYQASVDYFVAWEPPNNDRYRIKEILDIVDKSWYPSIQNKFISLHAVFKCISTKTVTDKQGIYLVDLMQSTVYKHLVPDDSPVPQYFLETPEEWGNNINLVCRKCNLDVNQLYNMYMVLREFYNKYIQIT